MLQEQVIIKYAKIKKVLAFSIALGIVWLAFMLWKIASGAGSYIAAAIVSIAGLLSIYISTNDMLKLNTTRLIISREGLTDQKGEFYAWKDIDQEKIERTGEYTHSLSFSFQSYVTYEVRIDISELSKTPEEIMGLIVKYRSLATSFPQAMHQKPESFIRI